MGYKSKLWLKLRDQGIAALGYADGPPTRPLPVSEWEGKESYHRAEQEQREMVREHILSLMGEEMAEAILTAEEARRLWWEERGMSFPSNGRIILTGYDYERLKRAAFFRMRGCGRYWHEHDTDKLTVFTSKQELNALGLDTALYEPAKPVIISIAFEDMILCSDYSSYKSCFSTMQSEYAPGGGRVYALGHNSAIVMREDTEMVPVDYARGCAHWNKLPWLPKKLGRSWVIGDDKEGRKTAFVWREYGRLRLGLLPLMDYFRRQGFTLQSDANTVRVGDLDMGFYWDEIPRKTGGSKGDYELIIERSRKPTGEEEWGFHALDGCIFDPEGGVPCYVCGEVQEEGETFTGLDGEEYCYDCYSEAFNVCEYCDEDARVGDMIQVSGGSTVCWRCVGTYYKSCFDCGEWEEDDRNHYCEEEGMDSKYRCGDCNEKYAEEFGKGALPCVG